MEYVRPMPDKMKDLIIDSPGAQHMQLYDRRCQRLYINETERKRLLQVALGVAGPDCTLVLTLLYTGCRISEALALTVDAIQSEPGVVSFRTLKKRGQQVHVREVPIPPSLVELLQTRHPLQEPHRSDISPTRLWPISRITAWQRIRRMMHRAGISGSQATPKGLRHGFGVHCVMCGVQINLIQKWMGHASMSTTAIYTNVSGPEELEVAARMWAVPAGADQLPG